MPPTRLRRVPVLFGALHMEPEHREWFLQDTCVSAALLLVLFFGFKAYYRHATPSKTARGLSWFLATVAAVVQSSLGAGYALQVLRDPDGAADTVWGDDRVSRLSVTFFGVFLVVDLVLGVLFYRKYVDWLSGWLHHVLYLLLVWTLLEHNATGALMPPFLEEIPTALLGLGNMFPALRQDLLFGFTFFTTRILFHVWYTVYLVSFYLGLRRTLAYQDHPAMLASCVAVVAATLMHIVWFSSWCRHLPRYLSASSKKRR
ncbi:hypothetical protein PTSG_03301 [Salpingoeca rosetta]|uniref:TLC domain-containing protein n=1 Tax=Salpingoeca rosetta (strain ATCC 50818 / BSB-021) TaxID=946362 RepID=F2U4S7_SALR5|nr:uncharacterized protein PTSG_03301 [Salpingoeca rosetta]EGD82643.1 hypothetical protein PTSG_03301 [Salpingoeca rosetta]|eukprot:XP_004995879.1 hypothetical protein PTSG_03301 [Salpingoeca rosetta]